MATHTNLLDGLGSIKKFKHYTYQLLTGSVLLLADEQHNNIYLIIFLKIYYYRDLTVHVVYVLDPKRRANKKQ